MSLVEDGEAIESHVRGTRDLEPVVLVADDLQRRPQKGLDRGECARLDVIERTMLGLVAYLA